MDIDIYEMGHPRSIPIIWGIANKTKTKTSSKTEGGVPILLKMTFFDLAAMTFDLLGFWKVVTQALLHSNNIS